MRLTVEDTGDDGESLIVGAADSISAPNGSVTLQVGDDVLMTGTLTAGDAVFIRGDFRNQDPGLGSTITLSGTISAVSADLAGD